MVLDDCSRRRSWSIAAGHVVVLASAVAVGLAFMAVPGLAQESESISPKVMFSLPIEVDFDHGAANGDAVISRFMPLVSWPIKEDWAVVNITVVSLADAPGGVPRPGNPYPVPGDHVFGLGDLTDAVFLSPPTSSERFVWGFGPAVTIPTASDDRLGSGKWSLGAAFRFAYRPGPWNLGALALNTWSVAGDPDRADVDQLLVRGTVRRTVGGGWFLVYAPVITANWNAPSEDRWLVPLGGGIGKRIDFDRSAIALSVQAYSNVIRPDGAPEWVLRIGLIVPVPGGRQQG